MTKLTLRTATLILIVTCTSPFIAMASTGSEDAPIAAKLVVGSGAPSSEATDLGAGEANIPVGTNETNVAATSAMAPAPLPKTETAKLPENEIPVLTGNKDVKKATGGGLSRVMTTLGVLAVLLGAAMFGIKRFSRRRENKNHNTRIKVLTQYALGPKKNLSIVQVAGETLLLGVTEHNISILKTLSLIDDEFPDEVPRNFNSTLDELGDDEAEHRVRASSGAPEQDDFAVRGLSEIRDKVSTRLRNMKHL